ANDTDPDPTDAVTAVVLASAPTALGGTVALAADGTFTYTPADGFTGLDSFAYVATDGILQGAPATASVQVTELGPAAPDRALRTYRGHHTLVDLLDGVADPEDATV